MSVFTTLWKPCVVENFMAYIHNSKMIFCSKLLLFSNPLTDVKTTSKHRDNCLRIDDL